MCWQTTWLICVIARTLSTLEVAVRPKCDMDAEEPIDNQIETDAVRPKSDMDAEKSAENENENDAVCRTCDDEAAAVDEDATNKQEMYAQEGGNISKKYTWRTWWGNKWRCRRHVARGEKQHLKEVSKQIRNCIRDKKRSKRQEKIQRIFEEFRGIKNRSCINSAKKRVLIPNVSTTKVIQSHRKKGLQVSSANSTVNYMQTMKLMKRFRIRWIMKPELIPLKKWWRNTFDHRSRNSGSNQQAQERQSQRKQWNPCRGHQDLWQWDKRNAKTDLQRSIQVRKLYSRKVAKKCGYKSYPRNKERRRRRKLSPDLYFASTVQTVFDYSAQQTLSHAWPTSIRRSGRIPAFLPSDRSHINLQDGWTEHAMSGKSKCGLRRLTLRRLSTPSTTTLLGRPRSLWYRAWVHQLLEKTQQKTKSNCYDWQGGSKSGPSRVIRYPDCSLTLYCRWLWKMTFHTGKRKKEWAYAWETAI